MPSNSTTIAFATDDIGVLISMAKVLLRIFLVALSLIVVVVSGYYISWFYKAIMPPTLSKAVKDREFDGDVVSATIILYAAMAMVGIPYLIEKDGAIMAFCYVLTWAWVFTTLFSAGVALAIAAAKHAYIKISARNTPTSRASTTDRYGWEKVGEDRLRQKDLVRGASTEQGEAIHPLSLMLLASKITTYTIYYTVTFIISLQPVLILCGGLLGCIGGQEWLSSRTKGVIAFGVPSSLYLLAVSGLLVAQQTGTIASEISWHGILGYSVLGMYSVALGLHISWEVLERAGKAVNQVVEVTGWKPPGWDEEVVPEEEVKTEEVREREGGSEEGNRKASGGDWVECDGEGTSKNEDVKKE
ncbi:hypothetical protein PRZ48_007175 [Zasmidium cellare]|uniref:Transmembrane protein n=1 Tax=Zasmidium cellare TaxID=395010 RepID=A0ABR0EIL9_ZASCE|nr:hypothetical protein PRZ48_007175 [Zasmidium cellare]